MEFETYDWILVVVFSLLFLMGGMLIGFELAGDITISQETGDKICLDLTNENGVVAKDYHDFLSEDSNLIPIGKGELYCQVPTYDSTSLIKVGS